MKASRSPDGRFVPVTRNGANSTLVANSSITASTSVSKAKRTLAGSALSQLSDKTERSARDAVSGRRSHKE
jgi:hypothetical protein